LDVTQEKLSVSVGEFHIGDVDPLPDERKAPLNVFYLHALADLEHPGLNSVTSDARLTGPALNANANATTIIAFAMFSFIACPLESIFVVARGRAAEG
jgi:hypothetical protein